MSKTFSMKVVAGLVTLASLAPMSFASATGYGGGGGGGGGCFSPIKPPDSAFNVNVDDGKDSDPSDEVTVNLNGAGSQYMSISNNANFDGAARVPFAPSYKWHLPKTGNGDFDIWVRFYDRCGFPWPPFHWHWIHHRGPIIPPKPPVFPGFPGFPGGGTFHPRVLGEKITLIDELIVKVKYGQKSDDVKTLQQELQKAGYLPKTWKITNVYGPSVLAAVNKYIAQLDPKTIDVDGLVADLKLGNHSTDVNLLQRALKSKGLFKLNPTSYYGPITSAAVKAYLKTKTS